MNYCPNCGEPITGGATRFCTNCGYNFLTRYTNQPPPRNRRNWHRPSYSSHRSRPHINSRHPFLALGVSWLVATLILFYASGGQVYAANPTAAPICSSASPAGFSGLPACPVSDIIYVWYVVYAFGAILGFVGGYKFYRRISRIDDRAILLLLLIAIPVLVLVTASFDSSFASASSVGYTFGSNFIFGPIYQFSQEFILLSNSVQSIIIPFLICMGLAELYVMYLITHTVYVR